MLLEQVNEAMFVGSPGWVVRPAQHRGVKDSNEVQGQELRKKKLKGKIIGISSRTFSLP